MKYLTPYIALLFALLSTLTLGASPKREFRGAWLQTIYQGQYSRMDSDENRAYLRGELDKLAAVGINAVIFQVRPQADAFFPSNLEPWSRFLSGKQGVSPSPEWDPLAFMVAECHARNMELHAWINPYRVTASVGEVLSSDHVYHQHPEWFIEYNKKIYFDPGVPQSRAHICRVVRNMVNRYDIDAIHLDDYFYPYPTAGLTFPDQDSFAKYGLTQNYIPDQRNKWRRNNVNLLIEELHHTIKGIKPWVQLGISPFGIYRNKRNDPEGSDTNGLQTYDDLHADVLRWAREGWIEYLIPQLYWELDHPLASSRGLVGWWAENTPKNCHLYIGQSITRTLDVEKPLAEWNEKMRLSRSTEGVGGNCFWSGYNLMDNYKGCHTLLKDEYHTRPALIPAYTLIDSIPPNEALVLKVQQLSDRRMLVWKKRPTSDKMQRQIYFCLYRFEEGEEIDLSNSSHLIACTRENRYRLPDVNEGKRVTFVLTTVDRAHNESVEGLRLEVNL